MKSPAGTRKCHRNYGMNAGESGSNSQRWRHGSNAEIPGLFHQLEIPDERRRSAGGSPGGDCTIGMVSYWRSVYAARAYRAGRFQRVVISGGRHGNTESPSVARAMADFMVASGVPREAMARGWI
jgi:hypothetical protein